AASVAAADDPASVAAADHAASVAAADDPASVAAADDPASVAAGRRDVDHDHLIGARPPVDHHGDTRRH
ncbi:MAG: hypothetical protein AAF548_08815, partial [Actinomycetota bacterium]